MEGEGYGGGGVGGWGLGGGGLGLSWLRQRYFIPVFKVASFKSIIE